MSVSKNLAELCALLVDEVFGELPARIFATLLSRGRLTLHQLSHETALSPRQLRHGLVVLVQHNLLYHYVDSASRAAAYEAKVFSAYALLRIGKFLDVVEESLGKNGPEGREVIESILLLGQARLRDLREVYRNRILQQNGSGRGRAVQAESTPDVASATSTPKPTLVRSLEHLTSILAALAEADFLEVVTTQSFQSCQDIYRDAEKRLIATHFPGGARGSKQKEELQSKLYDSFEATRTRNRDLKRKLFDAGTKAYKKQKIFVTGDISNGLDHGTFSSAFEEKSVVRVNLEKCLVSLRNRRLTALVADRIGVTTSQVYAVLLRLLGRSISRCRTDNILEIMGETSETCQEVTTADILNQLDISIDLSRGIGKASESHIDQQLVEALHPQPPHRKLMFDEAHAIGEASSDEFEEMDSSDASDSDFVAPARVNGTHTKSKVNGAAKHSSISTDRALGKGDRFSQLRQHLLLLCEGEQRFVRHSAYNQWTVDFQPLLHALQNSELDTVIESTSGRHGLRLARILRSKGKLDEKSLPNIALMKKADVQNKMLEMQMAGFVDIQEVPRDNNRTANRTMFLWFSDSERCLDQLLENTYKSMLRTLQNLLVQRRHNREVLGLAERKDVRGREEEIMETGTYNAYVAYRDVEGMLLNQLMRLDDLVAVLRDY